MMLVFLLCCILIHLLLSSFFSSRRKRSPSKRKSSNIVSVAKNKTKKLLVVNRQSNTTFNVPFANDKDIMVPNKQASVDFLELAALGCDHLFTKEHCHTNQVLHEFKSHIPMEHDCLEEWSEFIRMDNTLFHRDPDINTVIKSCSACTTENKNNNLTKLTKFFKAIASNHSLSPLLEVSVNNSGKPVSRLFLLTRYTRTEDKKEVIKACVTV
jgi:hypothetical protein